MARLTTFAITPGGAVGWLVPESAAFTNPASASIATIAMAYRVSGDSGENPIYIDVDTSDTQANIRSACKDAIKADILATFGVTIAKSAIKMANSLE